MLSNLLLYYDESTFVKRARARLNAFMSDCQRKAGKMLKMSTEGGQQNKFILTS